MAEYHRGNHCSLTLAKQHTDTPQHYWENVLWTDEAKAELTGNMEHYGIKRVLRINMKTSSQDSTVFWSFAALIVDSLPSLRGK